MREEDTQHIGGYAGGDAFVGADPRGEVKKAEKIRQSVLAKAKAGTEISCAEVDAFVGALNRAHRAVHGRPANRPTTQNWKSRLLGEVADLGGKVRGTCVSGMGDWVSSLFNTTGKVVGKTGELTARATGGAAKAIFWDAPKKTFFSSSGKKKPSGPGRPSYLAPGTPYRERNANLPDQGDVTAVTRHITAQQADVNARRSALQARIERAEALKSLADADAQDEAALAELEAKAAQAEAEAASLSGDDDAAEIARLKDSATQARVAKAALKSAGPYAKAALLATPAGKTYSWARDVWRQAKADADGAAKVAKIKEAADAGNPQAQAAVQVLAVGKKTDEELQAADLANRQMTEKAAEAAGVGSWLSQRLPTAAKSVGTYPGARRVFHLARRGNPSAVKSVGKAATLLQSAAQGDEGARGRVKEIQSKAAKGDVQAQTDLACLAVAGAGLREREAVSRKAHLLGCAREATVRGEEKRAAGENVKPNPAKVEAERRIARDVGMMKSSLLSLFSTENRAGGLAVKLAQHK